jgi:4-diphosphocytidyl-2-C-methyl-D-erythritol kinase
MLTENAPAKINLTLPITGKRADGYHLLDSLVAFAVEGAAAQDKITLYPAPSYALEIKGPYAKALAGEDPEKNLVTKALRRFAEATGTALDFRIALEKNLPVASGIGGGSADAGAALRAAGKLRGLAHDHPSLLAVAQGLGSDGLICYHSCPAMMRGIGDEIEFTPDLPKTAMLLVNPNIPLLTAPVYAARKGPFSVAVPLEPWPQDAKALATWLAAQSNDLQAPAIELCAAIRDVLGMLEEQEGCLLARLSGSGATCFALFAQKNEAEKAAAKIRDEIREWWVAVTGF